MPLFLGKKFLWKALPWDEQLKRFDLQIASELVEIIGDLNDNKKKPYYLLKWLVAKTLQTAATSFYP